MKSIQDFAEWFGQNRYNTPFRALDLRKQLTVLLDALGKTNMRKEKVNAFTTKMARAYTVHQAIDELRAAGYPLKSLLNLNERHVITLLSAWRSQGLAASTLVNRISVMRWLSAAVGKAGLVRDPVSYGFAAEDTHRPQVATEDKSWTAHGVEPAAAIAAIRQEDEWVAIQLEMCNGFGLRLTEALLIDPHQSHIGDTLRVEKGTKGGRTRIVPILEDHQRDLLERAKTMPETGSSRMLPGALQVDRQDDGHRLGL